MAQQVTADAYLLTLYKTWYTDKRFPNLLWRNSPLLKKIERNRIGGKEYGVAMLYSRGGAVSGDYTVAVALAAAASRNAEMKVLPGNLFSVFNITKKEILASQQKNGAYNKSFINRMFGSLEGARKIMAACLFGHGYGDVGQLPSDVAAAATSMALDYATVIKLDLGMVFYVTNGSLPSAAFYDAVARTVSAIDGNTITWTGGGATAGGWAAGSWVEISGGRDATPARNMPTGLAAWLPIIANRTGATWTTYIGTAFYGVTRSTAVNQLAGWYYRRTAGQTKADAVVQGLMFARRGGGVPDMIVLNDEDFHDIILEVDAQLAPMQKINTSQGGGDKNAVTRGLSQLKFAFSTSWLEKVIDDPYCPKGTCYILDSEVIEFAALSSTEEVFDDGVGGENEPGAATVESAKEPNTDFGLKLDDIIDIDGNATSAEGPAAQVSISLFGTFVVHEPGHCAVIEF